MTSLCKKDEDHESNEKLNDEYKIRRFLPMDIPGIRKINVDYLSETYSQEYYLYHLVRFPSLCHVATLRLSDEPVAYRIPFY